MASSLAWLDYSDEDQKRAREIVALFSQPESRDELGIGVVRDALSSLMFPGTSVIQTRARYFLFVPWIVQEAARRKKTGQQMLGWVDRYERKLIEALRKGGDVEGLIGRVAGTSVKILPSTIYWNGLQGYGILLRAVTQQQVAGLGQRSSGVEDFATELVDRSKELWDPNLPRPPDGFFSMESAELALTDEEAQWLAERIVSSVPASLLAWLVDNPVDPSMTLAGPWDLPAIGEAPADLRRPVAHGRSFSLVMQGAALVYNVLLAERAIALDRPDGEDLLQQHRDALEQWAADVDAERAALKAWNLSDLWVLADEASRPVKHRTRLFITDWVTLTRDTPRNAVEKSAAMLEAVRVRERQIKRGQSRLVNDRLMRQWGGSSGAGRLTYRWEQALRMLSDIEEGRSNAGS